MVENVAKHNGQMDDEGIQKQVLSTIDTEGTIKDSLAYAEKLGVNHSDLDKILKSLVADDYVEL